MLRNIGAVIVGLIAGNLWNIALILLNTTMLFPMGEGQSMQDPEQMKAYVATLPPQAFLTVLAAHVGQVGIGGWIAARLGKSRPMLLSGVVGALTVVGAVFAQIGTGGPAWMWIDVPLIIAASWFAGNVERKRRARVAV